MKTTCGRAGRCVCFDNVVITLSYARFSVHQSYILERYRLSGAGNCLLRIITEADKTPVTSTHVGTLPKVSLGCHDNFGALSPRDCFVTHTTGSLKF